MSKEDSKFTVIIKTFNSENTLINTLESVCSFGEIIALDGHSTDDTIDILNEYKVKTVFFDKFDYENAFNQAVKEAKGDWILVLEDNETVSENLLQELDNYSKNPKKKRFSIAFDIKTFYLNKEIKSAKEKNIVRFFKKEYCSYKKNSIKIISGKTCKIKNGYILKYISADISRCLTGAIDKNREILKHSDKIISSPIIRPILEFIKYYIFKFGFLDGYRGFIFAKEKYIERFILEVMFLEKNFKENK